MEPSTSADQGSSSKSHSGQEQTGLPKWNPKHKIFLSHSGEQKEFVRQLCKDLEAETHQPFFDERSSSLKMGERFAPLIFEAAKHCLVAVVVLSEDFLTSKWPMLELVEFVKAKRSHNPGLKLFPLFYKLSPDDIKPKCVESRWKAAWTKIITLMTNQVMPLDHTRNELSLNWCMEAISELCGANGLKFENFASEVEYREAIVNEISLLVTPELFDDTSDVIGKERLCKVLAEMFVEDTLKDSNLCGTLKLGLYGMGGLGKTTISRALCMFYYKHFNGRVIHIELGSRLPLDLQKLVLIKLLRINKSVVEQVYTVHEGRQLLKDHMNRQRVFLVIDNITHDRKSQMEALAYLEAGFHLGSMIMITSRSLDVVEELFPSHSIATYCKAMVSLNEEEARLIFLQRAAPQRKLETFTTEEEKIIQECLTQCDFSFKNDNRQYHPLSLQALADYYHNCDNYNVLSWKEHLGDLDKLRLSNSSSNVFGVLGLQFRTLALEDKLMFLDLCLYTTPEYAGEGSSWLDEIREDTSSLKDTLIFLNSCQYTNLSYSRGGLRWLEDIHEKTPIAVKLRLQSLKRLGIINFYINEARKYFLTIHDLYKEFAKWYVVDGEGSHWCVYFTMPTNSILEGRKLEGGSHMISFDSLPYILKRTNPLAYQVQRIRLENLKCATFLSKKIQEWCNVVVLQIYDCFNLRVLDLHGLSCLRHLELVGLLGLESFHFAKSDVDTNMGSNNTLESLQHVILIGLTSLKRLPNFSMCTLLKTFRMWNCEEFLPKPPQFMGCSQLEDLIMDWNWQWQIKEFKLDTLTSLIWLEVRNKKSMDTSKWSITSKFKVVYPLTLIGLGNCSQLQKLILAALPITNLLGLEMLTKLKELRVNCCDSLKYVPDISALVDLKHLIIFRGKFKVFPGIEKLLQLRHLEFEGCLKLTSLPNLDHLPKLDYIKLVGCKSLKVKPQVPLGCHLKVLD